MNVQDLKAQIIRAHGSGNRAELERLQDMYRRHAVVTASDRGHFGGTCRLDRPGNRRLATVPGGPVVQAPWPTISLSGYALDEVRSNDFSYREQAGWLTGPEPVIGSTTVEISGTVGLADDWDRHPYMVELPVAEAYSLQRNLPDGDVICGDFHSHPPESGNTPSGADLKYWARCMDLLGRPVWAGLIVRETQDDIGLPGLKVAGYVVRRVAGEVVHREVAISTWRY